MRILFIRHAQSTNNLLWDQTGNRDGRSSDPTLTDLGIKQTMALRDHIQRYLLYRTNLKNTSNFSIRLYSSLMWRALQTAQPIAECLNLPIVGLRDLYEAGGVYLYNPETDMNEGLPGKTPGELKNTFPSLTFADEVDAKKGWYNAPYEDDEMAQLRAKRFGKWLLETHRRSNEIVILISHGAFYNFLMNEWLGRIPPYTSWFVINNTGVTCIEVEDEQLYVLYTNRLDHLPEELIS